MRIVVTQDDIREGIRKEETSCPIAIAATRDLGVPAEATRESLWFDHSNGEAYCALPLMAREFIRRFDATGQGRPFVFEIEVVEDGGS